MVMDNYSPHKTRLEVCRRKGIHPILAVVLLFLGNTKFPVLPIKFLDLRLVD